MCHKRVRDAFDTTIKHRVRATKSRIQNSTNQFTRTIW